ncbi:hypothetical protein P43SY_010734 [Pythium insidiosum]|uniref:ZSWIM1/3 RNaseH-like domain-containing protein n=1 Tax=Pythium insidiosum TaxID=114742 RepID=A0AAD5LTB5_PYTIN|nr:hypothetical protein P43SY_010734 [Pythium insidiosum]
MILSSYNYQLCTLMLMNEYGEGLPIQQSLLETNGDWHMDRVLQHFKRVNPDVESRLKFIVVDKHLNEIRVLQAKPELGKIATQDHMAIDNLLHAMGYAQDGETYDTNMAALKDLCDRLNFGNFYEYDEEMSNVLLVSAHFVAKQIEAEYALANEKAEIYVYEKKDDEVVVVDGDTC